MTEAGTGRRGSAAPDDAASDGTPPGGPADGGRTPGGARDGASGGAGGAGSAPRRRRGGWKAAFVTLLILGVLGAVAWVLLGSRLLVVRHVEVAGTRLATPDRVAAAAGIRLGMPMVRLDAGEVRARVEGLREVESARIERRWPATVRIVVRERVPVAVLGRGGRYLRLDRYGVTVADGAARPGGLPGLVVASPGPSDPATLAALRVLTGLPERLRSRLVDVAATGPNEVTLHLSGGPTVVWGGVERTGEKVRLLEALRRTAAGRSARAIDVSSPEVVTTR
ncbi:cell division protein FtsQ/DivIB [Actinomadura roseirufa]|uniref:cell division protein FtsQ/DivIB n=1 Tax=Actinomadura roseirufa TaxID=2094049 RepID=UPI0010415ED9|nr:FtsQ-type POTRA domain-containing protein [Actinomadura roseirufa]